MSFSSLSHRARAVVLRYAQRRGISENKLHEFVTPTLDLGRHMLPHAEKAAARLAGAIGRDERVVIFGDYDADGVTSVALLLRFFRECTALRPMWKLPHRQRDQYGLEIEMARIIAAEFHPTLVIAIDNGSNSAEAVTWLRQQGIETIIIDHHPVTSQANDAVAIINPKAHEVTQADELTSLSAAGLALLFCNHLAESWQCAHKWERDTAIMIAGLGTLGDAVPLTSINRAIVKTAIRLLNTPAIVGQCPGLKAIVPADGGRITQRRIQFEIVPPVNALGRLEAADPGVVLLTTSDWVEAQRIAGDCRELNGQRKIVQKKIVAEGTAQGRAMLDQYPALPVLILAHPEWLPGVVGPAASRIVEQIGRSAILLGPGQIPDEWKGSGRAVDSDNLGNWIETVKRQGCLQRGGGHVAAVGVALHSGQIEQLRAAAIALPMPKVAGYEPDHEVIGELEELPAMDWLQVCAALEPCGRGNPWPLMSARRARLIHAPTELWSGGFSDAWALKGIFSIGLVTISVAWSDLEAAGKQWRKGGHYDLHLELSPKGDKGKIYCNWRVVRCEPTK